MKENKIPGFITVRTSSSRLPNKCLLPFGEMNVIQHIIRRAKHYNIEPIICTSLNSSDDILEEIARAEKVNFFRGSLNNKLLRWYNCAEKFGLEYFHTVDADDPFFDGSEMHRSIKLLNENNYDIVCPTKSSSNGGATVGYTLKTSIIKKALVGLDNDTDTEMMWYYIDKVEGLKKFILEESYENITQVRLTLDYEEDYWLLKSIQNILGNLVSNSDIYNFLKTNPEFYKINWFRNLEWKDAQLAKKI
jgi:spore coat polysaccharide biosynthesis protein SpsF